MDPFGLVLVCGLFRHPTRPKIDTYFFGMCNFLLNMRPRQAARENRLAMRTTSRPGTKPARGVPARYKAGARRPSAPIRIRSPPMSTISVPRVTAGGAIGVVGTPSSLLSAWIVSGGAGTTRSEVPGRHALSGDLLPGVTLRRRDPAAVSTASRAKAAQGDRHAADWRHIISRLDPEGSLWSSRPCP
jgi:hypothetical protein